MIVNPKQKKENLFFYNNLMFICAVFCLICFWTYYSIESQTIAKRSYSLDEGSMYGPIVVKKGQPKICKIRSSMYGENTNIYFSGEVLDKDKDTLYEFGKDLWHESGYDSEGYWSESDRNMEAKLAFTEPGTYYIQFHTDENMMKNISLEIVVKKGSGIPHLMMGMDLLIILYILFILMNRKWVGENLEKLNDALEEMSDD